MPTKKTALLLISFVLGGCLADARSGSDANLDGSAPARTRDRDKESSKPRQMCEATSIAGEAKSFCY